MDLIRFSDPEAMSREGVSAARFRQIYGESPPWEIGCPQPEVVRAEAAGFLAGNILDLGCGSGENALFLASRGHRVVGIDFVDEIVTLAQRKARERNLPVDFHHWDALQLEGLGQRFDTLLDCATFHTFSDRQRATYARSLRAVAQPDARFHLICFSDLETREGGPRRVSIGEIWNTFGENWNVVCVRPTRYLATCFPGGARAWAAELRRR